MTLYPHPKPQRLSTCHRHPTQPFTGFCASCLRERLAGADPATSQEMSSAYQRSNVAFRSRKSCSDAKAEVVPCLCDLPQRKSCDVRFRNTLRDLFNIDDERNGDKKFEDEMGSLGFVVAGSFLQSSSVFLKALRKWRLKQKRKSIGATEKKTPVTQHVRRLRETQSQVGDYGLGRRSHDSDPKFSVEAGRISMYHQSRAF